MEKPRKNKEIGKVASDFLSKTPSFSEVTRTHTSLEKGGFVYLINHKEGKTINPNELPINLHFVDQIGSDLGGFSARLSLHDGRGDITVQADGSLDMAVKGLTHEELNILLKHARTLTKIITS